MLKLIVWGFIIYLIYKFVFELVVPVSKATTQMKEKIKEMQEAQQRQYQQQQPSRPTQTPSSPKEGDYIDYEEVK